MPYFVYATDVACRLRLRRDNLQAAEKKAQEFLDHNYWDVMIEYPDGLIRSATFSSPAEAEIHLEQDVESRKSLP